MPERYVAAQPYPWPYNGDLQPTNAALATATARRYLSRAHELGDPRFAGLAMAAAARGVTGRDEGFLPVWRLSQ